MNKLTPYFSLFALVTFVMLNSCIIAQESSITELLIKPSETDTSITHTDVEHLILYNKDKGATKLFLFLPGTNGIPVKGPRKLFETAIHQGYKVINLSYINQPSVARICKGENLIKDINCTEKFRQQRVFGNQNFPFIPDQSQDAIVSRLTHLLLFLAENFKGQGWDIFLINGEINWELITVTGQSQGGGMSAFIAKKHLVNRIITFSGGWDYSVRNQDSDHIIATWYFNESITPHDRYFGTYHIEEKPAKYMLASYLAMGMSEDHIHGLSLEVPEGRKAHGQAIRNIVYRDLWIELMGSGNLE